MAAKTTTRWAPDTVAVVFYLAGDPAEQDAVATCPGCAEEFERRRGPDDIVEYAEATAVHHTGAENEVYCAICGRLLSRPW